MVKVRSSPKNPLFSDAFVTHVFIDDNTKARSLKKMGVPCHDPSFIGDCILKVRETSVHVLKLLKDFYWGRPA